MRLKKYYKNIEKKLIYLTLDVFFFIVIII